MEFGKYLDFLKQKKVTRYTVFGANKKLYIKFSSASELFTLSLVIVTIVYFKLKCSNRLDVTFNIVKN